MKERDYQKKLIFKLNQHFPNSLILKNDPTYIQGIPDLTIMYNDKFAMLEVKESATANIQPNQKHYVNKINDMGGYASFVYPENEEEVINGLKNYFGSQP